LLAAYVDADIAGATLPGVVVAPLSTTPLDMLLMPPWLLRCFRAMPRAAMLRAIEIAFTMLRCHAAPY